MKKRKSPHPPAPSPFPTQKRRLAPLCSHPHCEHRRARFNEDRSRGICVTFPEVEDENWQEFNRFCRTCAEDFFRRSEPRMEQTERYCAVLTMKLSALEQDDRYACLSVHLHEGQSGGKLARLDRRIPLFCADGRFCARRDLTKSMKNSIL